MRKIMGFLLFITVLLPGFSNDEPLGYSIGFLSGIDFSTYRISGPQAWDSLHLHSVFTGLELTFPVEEYPNQSGVMTLTIKKPFMASINQLDGQIVNLDTGTEAYLFGLYSYTGFLVKRNWNSLNVQFTGGPALDLFSGMSEGSYLLSLALELGADILLPFNDRLYTGAGLNLGYDFWGLHNMGDPERYDGFVKHGFGCQIRAFAGFNY